MATDDIHHRNVIANGLRFHIAEQGEGPPVILLHGFPELWYCWRHQFAALANAGFHAIAPDLRGYNESERSSRISGFRCNELVSDVVELIGNLNIGPAFIVGHDWGGLIAWRLAAKHREFVRKLVILNAAHPAAYRRELMRNPMQWLRSYYVLLFQLPWIPEYLLSRRDFAALEHAWRRQPVHPQAFTAEDIAEYKAALIKSGMTGPLNYYRAAMRYSGDLFGPPQIIQSPTLIIWGEHEPFMSSYVNDHLEQWVPNVRVDTISDASHWVQNDAPETVNRLLIDFFKE
jgi:epoxide hydrolase 4